MMHSDIKSRPEYRALEPDLAGNRHLLVIEGETLQHGRLDALAGTFAPVAGQLQTWLVGAPTAAAALLPIHSAMMCACPSSTASQ